MIGWLIGGIVLALMSLGWIGGICAEVVRGNLRIGSLAFLLPIVVHAGAAFAAVWMLAKAAAA